jgi:hypothetical protein
MSSRTIQVEEGRFLFAYGATSEQIKPIPRQLIYMIQFIPPTGSMTLGEMRGIFTKYDGELMTEMKADIDRHPDFFKYYKYELILDEVGWDADAHAPDDVEAALLVKTIPYTRK